jgi:hypothetical protein
MLVRARIPEAPSQPKVDDVHGAGGLARAEHKVGRLDVSMCLPIQSALVQKDGGWTTYETPRVDVLEPGDL